MVRLGQEQGSQDAFKSSHAEDVTESTQQDGEIGGDELRPSNSGLRLETAPVMCRSIRSHNVNNTTIEAPWDEAV